MVTWCPVRVAAKIDCGVYESFLVGILVCFVVSFCLFVLMLVVVVVLFGFCVLVLGCRCLVEWVALLDRVLVLQLPTVDPLGLRLVCCVVCSGGG